MKAKFKRKAVAGSPGLFVIDGAKAEGQEIKSISTILESARKHLRDALVPHAPSAKRATRT